MGASALRAPKRAEPSSATALQGNRLRSVVTVLEPGLRSRVDLAGVGTFQARHLDHPSEVERATKAKSVRVVLLSPSLFQERDLKSLAAAAVGFAGVVAIVISDSETPDLEKLLKLGACGAQRLVDLRTRDGLNLMRDLAFHAYGSVGTSILRAVMPTLAQATPDSRYFFERLILAAPEATSIRTFAKSIHALPSTLMSRFFRARLPSPKRYLAEARILYAAALLEIPEFSIAEVANRLAYSSPQSFGRHLREKRGLSANDFRYRVSFARATERFVGDLISPYEETFRSFVPLRGPWPHIGWQHSAKVAEP